MDMFENVWFITTVSLSGHPEAISTSIGYLSVWREPIQAIGEFKRNDCNVVFAGC